MANRLFSFALFGITAGTLWSLSRQLREGRRQDATKPKPMPVQTWEGEGGALPLTGAQLGPDPAVAQTTSPHAAEAAKDLVR